MSLMSFVSWIWLQPYFLLMGLSEMLLQSLHSAASIAPLSWNHPRFPSPFPHISLASVPFLLLTVNSNPPCASQCTYHSILKMLPCPPSPPCHRPGPGPRLPPHSTHCQGLSLLPGLSRCGLLGGEGTHSLISLFNNYSLVICNDTDIKAGTEVPLLLKGWTDAWLANRTDGWVDGWMDHWIDELGGKSSGFESWFCLFYVKDFGQFI